MEKLIGLEKQLSEAINNLTYSQTEELKKQIEDLKNTANEEEKKQIDDLLIKAEEILKEIEHNIWVQSREINEEQAKKLVPTIPDRIILNLSKALIHEGRPRQLLQTKAFEDRLAELQK